MGEQHMRGVKHLLRLSPCISGQQKGQHRSCGAFSGESKMNPVCECGACVVEGNPSWDARAQTRENVDNTNNQPPRKVAQEIQAVFVRHLVKSQGSRQGFMWTVLSRVWMWGNMCKDWCCLSPSPPVHMAPSASSSACHPTPTVNSSVWLGTHIMHYIIPLYLVSSVSSFYLWGKSCIRWWTWENGVSLRREFIGHKSTQHQLCSSWFGSKRSIKTGGSTINTAGCVNSQGAAKQENYSK